MSELSAVQAVFGLPFAQQIAFFKQKVAVPTKSYNELQAYEHDKAFVVAGAMKADLLTDLQTAVGKAIEDGETLAQFQDRFDDIVKQRGWTGWTGSDSVDGTAWRTKVIYLTNLRTSHAAGRYAQMTTPEMLQARPYWQYRHVTRDNPRLNHKRLDGKVLRADDGWWSINYPPNGYGCNCYVRTLSQADIDRLGLSVADTPDPDGYTQDGWEHAHGSTWEWRPDHGKYPAQIATALMQSLLDEGIEP